ncbi:AT-rich interactive domain-containing protein 1B isoform X2 [Stigmatopora argus]
MAAQVASAPSRNNNKNKKLSGGLGSELNSGKSGGGAGGGGGGGAGGGGSVQQMLAAGDGTLNNADHHRRTEPGMVRSSSAGHGKDGNNLAPSHSNAPSMETGLISKHKLKCVESGDPPPSHPQAQPPFVQFAPHPQRQTHAAAAAGNNNNNNGQGPRGPLEHHGGKENLLGVHAEPQGKGEGHLNKPTEGMTTPPRYEHANSGPGANNSEFNNNNNNYYSARSYEQHGGRQPGMGLSSDNSHEAGYQNTQYNQYPAYQRTRYAGTYGVAVPSGCRQPDNLLVSGNSSTSHGKSALGASSAGFQRFPGATQQQQQHPSGATPTLNQLLTSPSPMMRGYGGGYQDYGGSPAPQALGKDAGPQYGPPTAHGWGGQPRNHPHPITTGNGGQGLGRSQVSSMDFMAMKRSQLYGMVDNPYSGPQHPGGGPYPPSQPYTPPPSHRYPMGMPGRAQMGMGSMQYPQHQVAPYSQQGMASYSQQGAGQQGTPPYFSPTQQTPAGANPNSYLQSRLPPQEPRQENYSSGGPAPGNSGKSRTEDGISSTDRPSSLPDLSGSIDDLPTGTEAGLGSAVSGASNPGEQTGASIQRQSPYSPHASPRIPSQRSGPSPSPVGSPAGSNQSRSGSGPISPASGPNPGNNPPGSTSNPPSAGNGPDGPRPPIAHSPMAQEGGFLSNVPRNQAGSQFPMYPGMSPFPQTGSAGPYAPQETQYGHPGNYPRPSNYSGTPNANHGVPGPAVANSVAMNASSPMHGHGPGQPIPGGRHHGAGNHNRGYPTVAPSSPNMPQPAGPGMGPPCSGSSNRKEAATAMPSSIDATHNRPGNYHGPSNNQSSTIVPYSRPTANNVSAMGNAQGPAYNVIPSGPVGMSGDGTMMSPDVKMKADVKDDDDTHKPKIQENQTNNSGGVSQQYASQPATPSGALPVPSPLSPSPASLSSYHGDDSDSISSPPWPVKAPPSPKANPLSSTSGAERISRLYELGGEPERRNWVDRYLSFMEERGSPVLQLPIVGKKPLDLWKFYMAVREIGGLAMVNKNKKWRELSTTLSVGTSSSSASSLKKHYIQYLFAYECKMERGEEPPAESSNSSSSSSGSGSGNMAAGDSRKQTKIQPPSPANSGGSLQGPQTPQSSGGSSTAEGAGDRLTPTRATTPLGQSTPMPPNRSSVSVQDPFSDVSDPAFQKRVAPLPPSASYQQGLAVPDVMMRMQYDAKDPFAGMRKMAGADPYLPHQIPPGGAQDMYGRPPTAVSMSQRSQYSQYRPGYDRRPDHLMGMEGGMGPPGSQNSIPPHSEGGLYSSSRYPAQQRHDGYSAQFPGMPYGMHPSGMYQQQQGYKRPMDGMYGGPPPKRHESEMYAVQYSNHQADIYNHYGGGGYSGPDPRSIQGQFPYPYARDRIPSSIPSQHGMMSAGGDGPNIWPSRTDVAYPYPNRQIYVGREDGDGRPGPDQWHRQSPYVSSSFSSRHPQSSYANAAASMANHLPRVPSPGAFQRSLESRVSPSKAAFLSAMKMSKPGMPVVASQGCAGPAQFPHNLRRDLNYPPGSVEGTMPVLRPRRKLTSKDTGTPEAWRVMMSLKSGLLAESTWALDTINILLFDDSTVASFNLSQLPGFLELIVEYFRRCLIEIFGILKEFEIGTTVKDGSSDPAEEEAILDNETESGSIAGNPSKDCPSATNEKDAPDESLKKDDKVEKWEVAEPEPKPRQASKYDKFPISIVDADDASPDRDDSADRLISGLLHWQAGGGDTTAHIQTYFEPRGDPDLDSAEPPENHHQEEPPRTSISATIDDILCARVDALSDAHPARSLPSYPFRVHPDPDGQGDGITLLEDEARCADQSPLSANAAWQDALSKRCLCVSNVVRGLSFVPGNDGAMSRHPALVLLLGRLLLLHHRHPERTRTGPAYQRDERRDGGPLSGAKCEWWWECLNQLRENAMVTLANISGQLDLSAYADTVCLPVLDGLLHWMVCPSAEAQDPFPSAPSRSQLTPQRLVLECLCKLSIQEGNVDLLLATPPLSRQEKLFTVLVRYVGQRKTQVYREMAVAIASHLAQGDPAAARVIATQKGGVGNLVAFLEDGIGVAQYQHHPHGLLHVGQPHAEPPSVSMMCRAAKGLLAMAKVEGNKNVFALYESRLLDISISSVMNAGVAAIICQVLFHLGKS